MWSILTHLSFQSQILEKVLDQLTFLRVCLLWTFSLSLTNENDIIDILVTETNLYAQQQIAMKSRPPRILGSHSRLRNWMPVTRDEMLAFLGIVLSMGIIKKLTFESYWELNPCMVV